VIDFVGLNDDFDIMLYWQFHDLIDKVEEKTDGAVKFNFLGGPSVISWFEQFDALSTGMVPALWTGSNVAESLVPEALAMGLTHLTMPELWANGFNDLLSECFEDQNMIYLMSSDSSGFDEFLRCYLDVKVEHPEDLKGLKFGAQPNIYPLLEEFGGVPVGMSVFDYYTSFERGTIDGGFCTADDTIFRFSWNEVLRYFITPGIATSDVGLFMNLETWNKIPPDLQKVIKDSVNEVEKEWAPKWTEMHYGWVDKWVSEGGMEECLFAGEDGERWVAAYDDATWESIIAKSPIRAAKLRELAK